ncbi:MAG: hypothetical protein ACR2LS_06675 [Thermomicrobiales bacterium]
MLRCFGLSLLLLAILPAATRARQAEPAPDPGALLVTWQTVDGESFRAIVTDSASIQRVSVALAGNGYAGIPSGTLAHGDGDINAPHAWHLINVTVVDITIELCDGTASMVDADVDYWVDTVGRFCPWSATVVAAVPLQAEPPPAVSPTAEPTATNLPATPPVPTAPPPTPPVRPTAPVPAVPDLVTTPSGLVKADPATSTPADPAPHGLTLTLPDTGTGPIPSPVSLIPAAPILAAIAVTLLVIAARCLAWRRRQPSHDAIT